MDRQRRAVITLLRILCVQLGFLVALDPLSLSSWAGWKNDIRGLVSKGSICARAPNGKILFSLNGDRPMIPASTIKLLTASVALHYLGRDFRFKTIFGKGHDRDLFVKGFGDPYLISEEWKEIARRLRKGGIYRIRNIILDGTFFQRSPPVPGADGALDPYNAPVGALSSNFNTLFVRIDPSSGSIASAEKQTPMAPFIQEIARKSGMKGRFRINIGSDPGRAELHSGYLLEAFLLAQGVKVMGGPIEGRFPEGLSPFYIHRSSKGLYQVIEQMIRYSNNFIANQLFLTLGAGQNGPPATFAKGAKVMERYFGEHLGIGRCHIVEGSGLSRENTISAIDMTLILMAFKDHRSLLPRKGGVLIKTGTLRGVRSAAGYFHSSSKGWISFAILLNQDRDTWEEILGLFVKNL